MRSLVAVAGRENNMEKNREIADEAISHSQRRNSVSWIEAEEACPAIHHWLTLECDDYAATPTVVEYWGTDRRGEWRVHVRGAFACETGLRQRDAGVEEHA